MSLEELISIVFDWLIVNQIPIKWTLIAFVVSFITVGLPGAVFYFPTLYVFKLLKISDRTTDKLHGDSIWPMLIFMSLAACVLVFPIHLLIKTFFPYLVGWAHTLLVIMSIWLIGMLINIRLVYVFVKQKEAIKKDFF